MKILFLAASYGVHLLAAVFWVGGIAFILLIALPSAKSAMGTDADKIMGEIGGRFGPLANWSILVLVVTGVVLTWPGTGLEDLEVESSRWAVVLIAKLLLVFTMVAIHFFRGLILSRMIESSDTNTRKASLQKLSLNLVWVNLSLGVVILLASGALAVLR